MITSGGTLRRRQSLPTLNLVADILYASVLAEVDANTSRMIATIDNTPKSQPSSFASSTKLSQALALHKTTRVVKPEYHPPWKLVRVISGHLGWVRSVAVEPGNKWFATGAGDRVIKIWDLASGELKLSLTGHISTVRGLAVSSRHPYLFSCGEDKVLNFFFLSRNNPNDLYRLLTDGKVLGS
jgi:pleiotropic regulator 1